MSSTLRVENMWRLDDARNLISTLQPHLKPLGFHVALGGGVLNRGWSKKDLDLYFLPLDNSEPSDPPGLLKFLREQWGPSAPMRQASDAKRFFITPGGDIAAPPPPPDQDYPAVPGSPYTHKLKFTWSNLCIDVFVIGMQTDAVASDTIVEAEPVGGDAVMPEGIAPPFPVSNMWPDFAPVIPAAQAFDDFGNAFDGNPFRTTTRQWVTRRPLDDNARIMPRDMERITDLNAQARRQIDADFERLLTDMGRNPEGR